MDNKENHKRVTRAAKKRAASSMPESQSPQLPATKKRVVLGELPNSQSNVVSNPTPILEPKKAKCRLKKKEVKPAGPNIDADTADPQMCGPYASEIFEYLRSMEIEEKRRPIPDYLEKIQKDVTANMRGILVDWLVEVSEEYKLVSDTLYLTISYIDRFLSSHPINRQRLQLLGISCMLIAAKYEEISPPHVEDFCYITDNTYKKEEVVKMESDILKFLNFEMGNPTIKTFLRKFTKAAQDDQKSPNLQLEFLGCYLGELSLLDYSCIRFLPSMVAASIVFLSRFTKRPKLHPWNSTLQHCTGYRPSDLRDCVLALHDLQLNRKGGSLVAVRDKYKQYKFKCVATLASPPEIPTAYFDDV
ncbi:putative cyclin-A3-1 isoform X2 [Telopea speciosissima]|uniref:putative cyclin-A3-1 isoform X2 n=1 Tax=Telopea speciosissima TaxID=54955 RepID=UPI001CC6989F|nr:putative cyclin-A3-1 isoform X2 [Telopea speciosissima]